MNDQRINDCLPRGFHGLADVPKLRAALGLWMERFERSKIKPKVNVRIVVSMVPALLAVRLEVPTYTIATEVLFTIGDFDAPPISIIEFVIRTELTQAAADLARRIRRKRRECRGK